MGKVVLTSAPAPPATLSSRLFESKEFLQHVVFIFYFGLVPAIRQQASSLNPLQWINPWAWRDALWAHSMPTLLKLNEEATYDVNKRLVGQAHGRVLEVGAGSGETIKFYEESKIDKLFALEPFTPAIPHLAKTIAARGDKFRSRTEIIVAGVQDHDVMSRQGVTPGSLDSLVLVRCLCSIPGGPQAHLKRCVDLLKPGGTLIMIEHVVQSGDSLTRLAQRILNPSWRFMANGCELTRDSLGTLLELNACKDVVVQRPRGQTAASLLPHIYVQATKA